MDNDFLSGLPNRRLFDKQLEDAIQQANKSGKMVAVMMLDGHKFKQINDKYGHDAGDAVIKEMAIRLRNSIRETDTVARLGGDEMGIVLPELDTIKDAETIAQRIVQAFKSPLQFNSHEIKIGAGIGIAIYPNHSTYKKVLIKSADLALYEAKKCEDTQFRIYDK